MVAACQAASRMSSWSGARRSRRGPGRSLVIRPPVRITTGPWMTRLSSVSVRDCTVGLLPTTKPETKRPGWLTQVSEDHECGACCRLLSIRVAFPVRSRRQGVKHALHRRFRQFGTDSRLSSFPRSLSFSNRLEFRPERPVASVTQPSNDTFAYERQKLPSRTLRPVRPDRSSLTADSCPEGGRVVSDQRAE